MNYPDVDVAGCTRIAVCRNSERTDDDEVNAGGGKFGQHLGEVWVHR